MKAKRTKVTRAIPGAVVQHLGKKRQVVATIDTVAGTVAGTVAVRLHGCRQRKTYLLQDLYQWGPQLTLL